MSKLKSYFSPQYKKALGISLIFFLLAYVITSLPVRHGDGHEYSLVTKAVLKHLSVNVELSDVLRREQDVKRYPSEGYSLEYYRDIKNNIESKEVQVAEGIYKGMDGKYYGYHFWLYPALVAVVEGVLDVFGLNPLAAFQLFNMFLIIVVCLFIYFSKLISQPQKLIAILVFISGGCIFYVKWTHPEVLIYSLVFLAFFSLFQRKYSLAFLILGLASAQVISLALAFSALFVSLLLNKEVIDLYSFRQFFKKWVVSFGLIIALSSIFFYYDKFNQMSLIASSSTDQSLISFRHLLLFWTDLNQGVFIGAPWVLIGLIGALIHHKKLSCETKRNFYVAIMASCMITLPLLTQTNINSGQSVFNRYGLYAIAPLISWLSINALNIFNLKKCLIYMIIPAALYIVYFKGMNAPETSYRHKPWVDWILTNAPSLYNPDPEIFAERTLGMRYTLRLPVIYIDKHKSWQKVLITADNFTTSIKSICDGELLKKDGSRVAINDLVGLDRGWGYLNGPLQCDGHK